MLYNEAALALRQYQPFLLLLLPFSTGGKDATQMTQFDRLGAVAYSGHTHSLPIVLFPSPYFQRAMRDLKSNGGLEASTRASVHLSKHTMATCFSSLSNIPVPVP